jgi:hypothetical protein
MAGHDSVTESSRSVTVLRIAPTHAGKLPGFFAGGADVRTKDDYA